MQLIDSLDQITEPLTRAVVTIGNFDGVHIGHQALLHDVVERADAIDGTAVAMTFEPHPLRVVKSNGHLPLITMLDQKIELIGSAGIEVLIVVPFDRDFANLTARQFVADLLVRRIGMQAIVVGRDYAFGKNREGDLDLLQRYATELGFQVAVLDWIQGPRNGVPRISSTQIRDLVMAGDMIKARKLLGRHYQIRGTVARGRDRGGKLLGFPTANINLHDELCPKTGVYAVTVEIDGTPHPAVANIGYSPTFDDHLFTVEVHILDFTGDLYDRSIRVNFVERLRDEIKFSGIDELSAKIREDINVARQILANPLSR